MSEAGQDYLNRRKMPFGTDCKAVYAPVRCQADGWGALFANDANACVCRNKKMGTVESKEKCTGQQSPPWVHCCRGHVPLGCRFHDEKGSYNKNVSDSCDCLARTILHYGVCWTTGMYTSDSALPTSKLEAPQMLS